MSDVVIDTNIVIWHFSNPQSLSPAASLAVDTAEASGLIYVSVVTLIELVYLIEKSKIPASVQTLLEDALDNPMTAFRLMEVTREVANTVALISRAIVPEMPDRIIAATALHLNLPLVTADRKIQASNVQTIW